MTYPSEEHTATLGRFANMWGLTYNPARTAVVWSASGSAMTEWEAWNLTTRAYISSGTLDNTPYAPFGSQPYFGLGPDNKLYGIAGPLLGAHLVSWDSYGAGAQVDLGPAAKAGGCVALVGGGVTYLGCTSWANYTDGYLYTVGTSVVPLLLDTSVSTGVDWQIKAFVADSYGDIWALGGMGALAANQLAVWRVVNNSLIVRTDFFIATMPSSHSGSIAQVYACHVQSGTTDHFLVYWAETLVCTVNFAGAVLNSVTPSASLPYHLYHQVSHNHDTNRPTIWLGNYEYACSNLSLIRSMPYSLWGYADVGEVQTGLIYEPANNALLVGLENGNEDFAWLFLPGGAAAGLKVQIQFRTGKFVSA